MESTVEQDLRIFFAITLPDAIKNQIEFIITDLKSRYNDAIRWVRPHSLHITLQFLKNFNAEDLPALIKSVTEKIRDVTPLTLHFEKIELFPSVKNPNIISVSVQESNSLSHLSYLIGEALIELDYAIEQRPFRAHLTLGRVNRLLKPKVFYLKDEREILPLSIETSDIILYRSRPELAPSHYMPLHTFDFALKMATK